MFVVELTYKQSLALVDQYIDEHKDFLAKAFSQGFLVASGPKPDRSGGVIIVDMDDQLACKDWVEQDPFYLADLIDYRLIAFTPSRRS